MVIKCIFWFGDTDNNNDAFEIYSNIDGTSTVADTDETDYDIVDNGIKTSDEMDFETTTPLVKEVRLGIISLNSY